MVVSGHVNHLADERYDRLVIEVDDPWAAAASISQALTVGPGANAAAKGS